ncbi:MAG TPA: 16S rRNA (uracil(1498)-N(3))-methyltransferase [Gammaproteobacteria bacterium]|nr:16S rRNA (uracil(1498)-N(3))-methyltransferase [Gammaproteobacteria bacterium]
MKPTTATTPPLGRVPRLYHDTPINGAEIVLDDKQAHYLRQVLRLKRGYSIIVFDGRGSECLASIMRLTRDGAELRVESSVAAIPRSSLQLTLLQAIPKSEAMDLIVQKATELGVTAIAPVVTEFCVVRLDEDRARNRVEHWRRVARSACEQSGRHEPAAIEMPDTLARRLNRLATPSERFALDARSTTALRDAAAAIDSALPVYILIGPEGGLSERDLACADQAGFTRVTLGRRILRSETAAIAASTLLQALSGDLG